VQRIAAIEGDRFRGTLESRPEQFSIFSLMIERERMKELSDLVVENILEHASGKFNTGLIIVFLLNLQNLLDALKSHPQCYRFVLQLFDCLVEVFVRALEEFGGLTGYFD